MYPRSGITVRNGVLIDLATAVSLQNFDIRGARVEQLRIERAGGINVGEGAVVRNNTVTGSGVGVYAGMGAHVSGNTTNDNGVGILTRLASLIGSNNAVRNANMGIRATERSPNGGIFYNEVNNNGGDGMAIQCPAVSAVQKKGAVTNNDVWFNNRSNNNSVPIRMTGTGCWSGSNVAF